MLLVIIGAIIAGGVGLAALYDHIARRRGADARISATGPFSPGRRPSSHGLTQDGSGKQRLIDDGARRSAVDGDA